MKKIKLISFMLSIMLVLMSSTACVAAEEVNDNELGTTAVLEETETVSTEAEESIIKDTTDVKEDGNSNTNHENKEISPEIEEMIKTEPIPGIVMRLLSDFDPVKAKNDILEKHKEYMMTLPKIKIKGKLEEALTVDKTTKDRSYIQGVITSDMDLSEINKYKDVTSVHLKVDAKDKNAVDVLDLSEFTNLRTFGIHNYKSILSLDDLKLPNTVTSIIIQSIPNTYDLGDLSKYTNLDNVIISGSSILELNEDSIPSKLLKFEINQAYSDKWFSVTPEAAKKLKESGVTTLKLLGLNDIKDLAPAGLKQLSELHLYDNTSESLSQIYNSVNIYSTTTLGIGGSRLKNLDLDLNAVPETGTSLKNLYIYYSPQLDISELVFNGDLTIEYYAKGISNIQREEITVRYCTQEMLDELVQNKTIQKINLEYPLAEKFPEVPSDSNIKEINIIGFDINTDNLSNKINVIKDIK